MQEKSERGDDGIRLPPRRPPLVRQNALSMRTDKLTLDQKIASARKEVAEAHRRYDEAISMQQGNAVVKAMESMMAAAQRKLDILLHEKENPLYAPAAGIRGTHRRARVHF